MDLKVVDTYHNCENRKPDLVVKLWFAALVATCLLASEALAQEGLVLHGIVTEVKTNKPIEGATVTTQGRQEIEPAYTERHGKFSLYLNTDVKPSARIILRVVRDGYYTAQEEEAASPNITITIQLKPKALPPPSSSLAKLPPVIAGLVQELRDGDTAQREGAAYGLGKWGTTAAGAIPYLAFALQHDDETKVRIAAAASLGIIGISSRRTTTALMVALSDSSSCEVQSVAADVLGTIGTRGPDLDSALQSAMKDPCVRLRLNASAALVEKASDVKKMEDGVVEALVASIREPEVLNDPDEFGKAAQALAALGQRAYSASPILISIADDEQHPKLAALAIKPLVVFGASARPAWEKTLLEVPFTSIPGVVKNWLQADSSMLNTEESAESVFNAMHQGCKNNAVILVVETAKKIFGLMPWAGEAVSTCLMEVYLGIVDRIPDLQLIVLRAQRAVNKLENKACLSDGQSDIKDEDLSIPQQICRVEDAIVSIGPDAAPAISVAIKSRPNLRPDLYPLLLRANPSLAESVTRDLTTQLSDESTIDDALRNLGAIETAGKAAAPEVTRLLCSDHSRAAAVTLETIRAIDAQTIERELRANASCAKKTADITDALSHNSLETTTPSVTALARLFVSGDEIVSATAYSILRSIGTNVSAAVPILVERLKDCETLPGDFRKDSESAGKEIGIIDFLPNLLNKLPFDETTAARDRLDKCSMSRNREMRERASAAIDRLRKPK